MAVDIIIMVAIMAASMVAGDVDAGGGVIIDGNIHVAGVAGQEDIAVLDVTTTGGKYLY